MSAVASGLSFNGSVLVYGTGPITVAQLYFERDTTYLSVLPLYQPSGSYMRGRVHRICRFGPAGIHPRIVAGNDPSHPDAADRNLLCSIAATEKQEMPRSHSQGHPRDDVIPARCFGSS